MIENKPEKEFQKNYCPDCVYFILFAPEKYASP